ncbi:MAG: c-type cytochrome [Gammaproteobacteria bacterium]
MSPAKDNFLDNFTLVIGILIGIAVGIFFIASSLAEAQTAAVRQDPAYQGLVMARLEPAGKVVADGETRTVAVSTAAAVAAPLSGPDVYNSACVACHGQGIGGAPRVGDVAAWAPRIAQGPDVLSKHALQGYTGPAGYMPPKGGRVDLSDDEILAAVAHMLEESR